MKSDLVGSLDKYVGCMLGLAAGDALGAPFEGGLLERGLWKLIGLAKGHGFRYTDDTQMAMDVVTSFLACKGIDQNHLANTFSQSYQWSRGYGPAAAKLLKKIKGGASWQTVNRLKYSDGSMGNGAAMRAPVVALCFPKSCFSETGTELSTELKNHVQSVSEITHAHPLATEGASLISTLTLLLLNDEDQGVVVSALVGQDEIFKKKLSTCLSFLKEDEVKSTPVIRQQLGNGITAPESVVTAIYYVLAFRHRDFDSMMSAIIDLKGDVDTIGSMAGAMWGAANGATALKKYSAQLEAGADMKSLANQLFNATHSASA